MGFEDEVEQSLQRPRRQTKRQVQADMRTHLIHRAPGSGQLRTVAAFPAGFGRWLKITFAGLVMCVIKASI
jgi:hypothetical protein